MGSPDRLFSQENSKYGVEVIKVAGNRGPCAGVNMAYIAVKQALEIVDGRETVWTNWPVVNNNPVMEELIEKGLRSFDNDWNKVPDGSIVIFSAHGVTPEHHNKVQEKGCLVIDTTCLLVTKVHDLVIEAADDGQKVAYIGVEDHPETTGVLGELENLGKKRNEDFVLLQLPKDVKSKGLKEILGKGEDWVVYSQTTLMPDEVVELEALLGNRFPDIYIPDRLGICYATFNRQKAVERLIDDGIDLLLVVGSPGSHNSQMLKRKGKRLSVPSYSLDYPHQLKKRWFKDVKRTGVTSGASVFDYVMQPVVDLIVARSSFARVEYQEQVKREPMDAVYPLPVESIQVLRDRFAA